MMLPTVSATFFYDQNVRDGQIYMDMQKLKEGTLTGSEVIHILSQMECTNLA
jgi:hypothetical protein